MFLPAGSAEDFPCSMPPQSTSSHSVAIIPAILGPVADAGTGLGPGSGPTRRSARKGGRSGPIIERRFHCDRPTSTAAHSPASIVRLHPSARLQEKVLISNVKPPRDFHVISDRASRVPRVPGKKNVKSAADRRWIPRDAVPRRKWSEPLCSLRPERPRRGESHRSFATNYRLAFKFTAEQ